jgi:hypothetical protein
MNLMFQQLCTTHSECWNMLSAPVQQLVPAILALDLLLFWCLH